MGKIPRENKVFCQTILPDLFLASRKVRLKYQVSKNHSINRIKI